MEIENLTFGDGLILTTNGTPPLPVTDELRIELTPESYDGYTVVWDNSADPTYAGFKGTLYGGPTFNSLTGFTFDSPSEYTLISPVQTGVNAFTSTAAYTIEVWFNPSNQIGQQQTTATIFTNYEESTPGGVPYWFQYSQQNETINMNWLRDSGPPIETDFQIPNKPINTWYQAVCVYNFLLTSVTGTSAQSASAYINGVKVEEQVGTCPYNTPALNPIRLTNPAIARVPGRDPNTMGAWFNGQIGIVRIYAKALTSAEVLQNFQANRNRFGI